MTEGGRRPSGNTRVSTSFFGRSERSTYTTTVLTQALDSDKAGEALVQVERERARTDLFRAEKIAERRSGARGADARKALLAAEAVAREAEAKRGGDVQDAVEKVQALIEEVKDCLDAV